ncbi:MAG: 4'-phosphopantetheinyl transferase superfamily protein [Vicingus serpentipes]|nr:4'-phosphopantetheinyl transferase superfamily protein [Vicingus serpentipes]
MAVFIHKNINNSTKLGVWHITESKEELFIAAKNQQVNFNPIQNLKNENRIKQWIATRLLLNDFFHDTLIIYDDLGKPSLNNGWHISISHSGNYVAILLNEKENCGIDIERISPKVTRIKHKFLNEKDLTKYSSEKELTTLWCAKEALYKYYGKKEILFIEHLFIKNFKENVTSFNGKINMTNYKKEIPMTWEKIENYILVYTL